MTETLHLLRGVKYYNTDIVKNFKAAEETEPNSGNMTVYASLDNDSLGQTAKIGLAAAWALIVSAILAGAALLISLIKRKRYLIIVVLILLAIVGIGIWKFGLLSEGSKQIENGIGMNSLINN